jgi:hypothetical protein
MFLGLRGLRLEDALSKDGAARTASNATELTSKIANKILLMREIITQTARESKL